MYAENGRAVQLGSRRPVWKSAAGLTTIVLVPPLRDAIDRPVDIRSVELPRPRVRSHELPSAPPGGTTLVTPAKQAAGCSNAQRYHDAREGPAFDHRFLTARELKHDGRPLGACSQRSQFDRSPRCSSKRITSIHLCCYSGLRRRLRDVVAVLCGLVNPDSLKKCFFKHGLLGKPEAAAFR